MNCKRFLAIPLLAICAITALPRTAYAAMIDADFTGSITIHSIAVEDTSAHQTPATGEEQEVEGEPLENIRYTVTRVADDATEPTEAEAVTGEGAYKVTTATDSYGRARFGDLALGVYLVHQEENAAVEEAIGDFLVDVPMTNPAGTSRIFNVNIYPKYQLAAPPDIDAFVTEEGNRSDSLDLHGRSTWIAAAQIPENIADAKNYLVQSTLHNSLTFTEDSMSVYAEGNDVQRLTLAVGDYTVSLQDQLLSVSITESGLEKLGGAPASAGATLYVEYETTLDIPEADLADQLAEQIGVDTKLYYTSPLGRPSIATAENAPYVYTGGVGILKTAAANGAPLPGASFKLYRTRADAVAETNAVQKPGGAGDWVVTTNENGIAAFEGIAYGGKGISNTAGDADYYLVQTLAPSGYNLLRAPVEITVNTTSHLEENQVTVVGRTGFLLPATGGIGTFWFTAIGLFVIFFALYFFWRARRKKTRNNHKN